MYTNWSRPTPGNITYLIHDGAVVDALVVREIKYGPSFKKDRSVSSLTAGEHMDDAYARYEIGLLDEDGEWIAMNADPDDLFETADEAFTELRKRRGA